LNTKKLEITTNGKEDANGRDDLHDWAAEATAEGDGRGAMEPNAYGGELA